MLGTGTRLDEMERRLVFLTNEIRDADVAVGHRWLLPDADAQMVRRPAVMELNALFLRRHRSDRSRTRDSSSSSDAGPSSSTSSTHA